MHPLFHLISAVHGDIGMPTLREPATYCVMSSLNPCLIPLTLSLAGRALKPPSWISWSRALLYHRGKTYPG